MWNGREEILISINVIQKYKRKNNDKKKEHEKHHFNTTTVTHSIIERRKFLEK